MSTISDELRDRADGLFDRYGEFATWLRRTADRIDAEMVELPKGKDQKPIRPEEVTYLEDGSECLVAVMKLTDCGWMVYRPGDRDSYSPGDLTHERPDSWERIAQELDDISETEKEYGFKSNTLLLLDLAERVRRLAEREDKHERE